MKVGGKLASVRTLTKCIKMFPCPIPGRQNETLVEWALRVLESYQRNRDLLAVSKVVRKSA
jgi:hypothetical protein